MTTKLVLSHTLIAAAAAALFAVWDKVNAMYAAFPTETFIGIICYGCVFLFLTVTLAEDSIHKTAAEAYDKAGQDARCTNETAVKVDMRGRVDLTSDPA